MERSGSVTMYDEQTNWKRGVDRVYRSDMPGSSVHPHFEERTVWRGDHRFSSEAASFSLTNFIEPDVARAHPDWTKQAVREEALKRFEKRLAQDLSYEKQEHSHEETEVVWKPIQTSNGQWELATQYGDGMVTLSELWEHTKKYAEFVGNPAAYNKDEHRAQLSMQDAFIRNDASGFVSVLSHPDAVRYVQVWKKNEEGDVVSRQVDLYKTTGRDFSHEESTRLISAVGDFYQEHSQIHSSDYAHVFIEKRDSLEADIRIIALAQTLDTVGEEPRESVEFAKTRISLGTVGNVLTDTKDSLTQLGEFVIVNLENSVKRLIAERDGRYPDGKIKVTLNGPQPIQSIGVSLTENFSSHIEKTETKTKDEIIQTPVESIILDYHRTKTIVRIAAELPAGPAAVLFWLEHVGAAKQKKSESIKQPLENPVESNEIIDIPTRARVVAFWRHVFERALTPKKYHEKKFRKTAQKENGSAVTKFKRLDRLGRVLHKPIGVNNKEWNKLTNIEKTQTKLLIVWRKLSRIIWPNTKENHRSTAQKVTHKDTQSSDRLDERKRQKLNLVREYMHVLITWILVTYKETAPKEKTEASIISPQIRKNIDVEKISSESIWILLAIIWKLSLLREAGFPVFKASPKKKSSTSLSRPKRTGNTQSFGMIFTLST